MSEPVVEILYDVDRAVWTVSARGRSQPLGVYPSRRGAERDARLFAHFVARYAGAGRHQEIAAGS